MTRTGAAVAAFGALWSGAAGAHVATAAPSASLWSVDAWAVLLLLGMAWCYARGRRSGSRRGQRPWLFWSALATLAVALGPPLDALGGQSFAAHMLQHELLMLVSAPLLVLSRPAVPLCRGLPALLRRGWARCLRGTGLGGPLRRLATPAGAWSAHALALWVWHLPALFEAGLGNSAVHAAQHGSFLFTAVLFWQALLRGRRRAGGGALLYLFTTAVHSSVLGALLTFAPTPWYAPYRASAAAFGLSALEDQQLGGLIMWVPSGLVFLLAALALLVRWLHAPRWPVDRGLGRADG